MNAENRPDPSHESALSELAQLLLDNPVINQAVKRAGGARDLATTAQTQAMKSLNVATAAELDRLARRLRSVSDRIEELEDALDRVSREVTTLRTEKREESTPDAHPLDQPRLDEERLGLSE